MGAGIFRRLHHLEPGRSRAAIATPGHRQVLAPCMLGSRTKSISGRLLFARILMLQTGNLRPYARPLLATNDRWPRLYPYRRFQRAEVVSLCRIGGDELSQRLTQIPGIGVIGATMLALKIPAPSGYFTTEYQYALNAIRDIQYYRWREFDPEHTVRFISLRLHEAGRLRQGLRRPLPKVLTGDS